MAEQKTMRLNKVLREFNISLDRAVDYLKSKGHEIEARPTTKISEEVYQILFDEFQTDKSKKVASKEVGEEKRKEKEELRIAREKEIEQKQKSEEKVIKAEKKIEGPKTLGKIDLNPKKEVKKPTEEAQKAPEKKEEKPVAKEPAAEKKTETASTTQKEEAPKAEKPTEKPAEKSTEKPVEEPTKPEEKEESQHVATQYKKLDGPNFTGQKIDLGKFDKPKKKPVKAEDKDADKKGRKGKRKRIAKDTTKGQGRGTPQRGKTGRKGQAFKAKEEPSEEEVQKQIRETLEKLQGKSSKGKGAKYRRNKRDTHRQKTEDDMAQQEAESKILRVTEFVTVSEVATLMNVPVTDVISACMSLGMMVTMNQRLDAETLTIVADEFGFEVKFTTAEIDEIEEEVEEIPKT